MITTGLNQLTLEDPEVFTLNSSTTIKIECRLQLMFVN